MKYKIINYTKENISINVRYDEENNTIWLTQSEIALIFDTTRRNVGIHIKNIIGGKSDFLPQTIELLVNNQKTKAYNLELIKAISERSKSISGYDFIEWANTVITNNSNNELAKISLSEDIKSKIYIIRGEKVMLDFELAELYGYDTKRFNEQVKNNINKFPERYRFQLTMSDVYEISRSKNSTAIMQGAGIKSGRTSLPYAITEQGIYML